MNRRNFIKVICALLGTTVIPQEILAAIPEVVPNDWRIKIGYLANGEFIEQTSVGVDRFIGANQQTIIFPMVTHSCNVTHVSVNGILIPLAQVVCLGENIQPIFSIGSLSIIED